MACSTASGKNWKAALRSLASGRPSIRVVFLSELQKLRLAYSPRPGPHLWRASRISCLRRAVTHRSSTYGLTRTLVNVHGPAVGVRLQKAFKKLGRLGNETWYKSA